MFQKRKYLQALNDSFQTEFTGSYEAAVENSWAPSMASIIQVSGRSNVIDMMVENLKIGFESGRGTRTDLKDVGFQIDVRRADGGFELEKADFLSLQNLERAAVRGAQASAMLGYEAKLFPQSVALQLLTEGTSRVCFDGKAFFATDHPNNYFTSAAGTYSNYETGKDLTTANVAAAVAQLRGRKMPNGTPRNLKPEILFHSTDLEARAWSAIDAQNVTVQSTTAIVTSRILAMFGLTPVCIPGLPAKWWGVSASNNAVSRVNKPLIIGELAPFSLTDYSDLTDAELRRRSVLEYTAEGFLQAQYGWPYLIHLCVET